MSDTFELLPNTSADTNNIGSTSAYFDNLYVTNINTVTLTSTTTVSTGDKMIILNGELSGQANGADLGIAFERGTAVNVGLMWDETADRFTFVQSTALTGASTVAADLNLESATLSTLRANLTGSSITVESGGSITVPTASIDIRALDIEGGGDGGAAVITNADLFILHDDTPDSPRSVTASALKTYIAGSNQAIDLTASGLGNSLITTLAATDRFLIGDASAGTAFSNAATALSTISAYVIGANDTDALSEGSTNLYHTAARARASFSAGTGIDISAGVVSIPQAVATTSEVTFAKVTAPLTGNVTGNVIGDLTGDVTGTVSDISNHDTGDLSEGSNLYHTTARARGVISVTDSGGDGSLAYNSTSGVITYTGPSASEVQAHITAGTGVGISSGEVSIGQAVATTSEVTFAKVTSPLTGAVTGNVTGDVTGTVSSIANHDTGDLSEGSNLYHTTARARGSVSVTDSGGDGSLSYNSTSGVITYTGPSASEVQAHITAGTGVGISSGQVSIGQAVATTSEVAFAKVTAPLTGAVTGNVTGDVTGTVSDISNHDTGDLSEGSNLYHTTARARGSISVTDSGGDGSLAYNSTSGVITYTGPSAAEVQAHITAGTGVGITGGEVSIGQAVATTSEVTFAKVTSPLTGAVTGNVTGDVTGTVSDISNHDTGDLSEGSNLYHTTARARSAISVTDSGGDGSLAYNSTSGVITYTGPSAAEVQAHITAGTGVAISSGQVSIGQAVGTTDTVTFGTVNAALTGDVTGTAAKATAVTATASTAADTMFLAFTTAAGTNKSILIDTVADNLSYQPSTGTLTLEKLVCADVSGNISTANKLGTAVNIGGVAFDGSQAIVPNTINVADEENAAANRLIIFADAAGTQQPKNDGDFHYNPSTGTVTATKFNDGTATLTGGALAGATLTEPKFANNGYIADSEGNHILQFISPGSAVNHIKVTNAATGSGAQIETVGGDTNIDLNLVAKGTGVVKVTDKLRVTGQSNFDSQLTVGASGSEANLYVYGELHVDNGVAVFDTASMSLQDPLLFMAKDGAGSADIGFFGKTGTITGASADGTSDVACHTGIFFDSDQRNTGKGLYRFFRAPTGNVSADNVVTVNKSQNFVNPAIEACNIKADITTVTSGPNLNLGNKFVLVNGNVDTTLPAPSATYEGVEFVIRMITGDTPDLVPASAGQLINSSGTAANIPFSAHGTLRVVCGKAGNGDYKWYQV